MGENSAGGCHKHLQFGCYYSLRYDLKVTTTPILLQNETQNTEFMQMKTTANIWLSRQKCTDHKSRINMNHLLLQAFRLSQCGHHQSYQTVSIDVSLENKAP